MMMLYASLNGLWCILKQLCAILSQKDLMFYHRMSITASMLSGILCFIPLSSSFLYLRIGTIQIYITITYQSSLMLYNSNGLILYHTKTVKCCIIPKGSYVVSCSNSPILYHPKGVLCCIMLKQSYLVSSQIGLMLYHAQTVLSCIIPKGSHDVFCCNCESPLLNHTNYP